MRSPKPFASAAVDPAALARLRALGERHHIDLLADARHGFDCAVPALIDSLQAAVLADSPLRLRWSARALRTRAEGLGAQRIVRLSRALESRSFGATPLEACLPAIESLAEACASAAAALRDASAL